VRGRRGAEAGGGLATHLCADRLSAAAAAATDEAVEAIGVFGAGRAREEEEVGVWGRPRGLALCYGYRLVSLQRRLACLVGWHVAPGGATPSGEAMSDRAEQRA
jgi:hypothetical protein